MPKREAISDKNGKANIARLIVTFEDLGIVIPHGASGNVKTKCPQCSAQRRHLKDACLSVDVERGLYKCHHCEWQGGLSGGRITMQQRQFRKPEFTAAPITDQASAYLAGRGISKAIAESMGVTYIPNLKAVAFPYYRGDEVVNVKYRSIDDKKFSMEKDCELTLYNHRCISGCSESLCWVEGEADLLSVMEAGHLDVVSVPNGAQSKLAFLDGEMDSLLRIKRHVIAVDRDPAGRGLEQELVRRLGADRCVIVSWPEDCKDANDVLCLHGKTEVMWRIMTALPVPIAGVFQASDYLSQLDDYYQNGAEKALSTGWDCLDRIYRVRAGDLTVVTGIPGTGKTSFVDCLAINVHRLHGWRLGIYSPENYPVERHLATLIEKLSGRPFFSGLNERVSPSEMSDSLREINEDFFWMVPSESDKPDIEWIISRATSLVRRQGINALLIDPWNEVEHVRQAQQSETEYIGDCLRRLKRMARELGIHVWVVAHPTKMQKGLDGQYPVPTPYDINGGANWRNKADVCLSLWRQFDTNNKVVTIFCQKARSRDIGQIGECDFEYEPVSGRYVAHYE